MPIPFQTTRIRAALRAALAACAGLAGLGLLAGAGQAQDIAQGMAQDGTGAPSFTPLPPPSLNFYGSSGLIDMPTADMLPDGQYTTTMSYFGGTGRFTLTFQALPWLSASFRYNGIANWNLGGFATYYDRGFDIRLRLLKETGRLPGLTLGLQDFVGTGIYAGEYLVATKSFTSPGWGGARLPGRLQLTGGIGWGRLGSYGSLGSLGNRPVFNVNSTGGSVAYDQWFRGPYALFGGLEWRPNDRLGLKLEYSSDDYLTETRTTSVFQKKSPFNFGVEYQYTPRTRLGAYYMYGSEVGVSAQIQLNPRQPPVPLVVPAPHPIAPRPDRAADPAAWDTGWAASRGAALSLRDQLAPILAADGLVLETLSVEAESAELRFRNLRYRSFANAVGRAARALAQVMPASVETFRLVPMEGGMALAAVVLRRSDLEALEFDAMTTEALLAVTGFTDAPPLPAGAVPGQDLYPDFAWSLTPFFEPAYFDPSQPVRFDYGVDLSASYRPAPGWVIAGTVRHRLGGNVKDGRASSSVLPHVRTDQVFYAQDDTTLNSLFVSRQWRPGGNLYARVSGGYLERMYAGLSGEILWKPVSSRLALGLEANYVVQREFDDPFGLRDYRVFTGHGSAYYDLGGGFEAQLDVGRYLAGDFGATFGLDRHFDNGWMVGGFFTLTNVSAAEFGEGSFDKGIRFRMPVSWFLGKPSRRSTGTLIRPIQRDGGQRLAVAGRLYPQLRETHRKALAAQWARVWE